MGKDREKGGEIDFPQRLEFIKDEYMMLQGFYEDFDERCITIKGWSITVGLAALGAGFAYNDVLFLGALLSGLLFWYLEGYYRGLSYYFSQRIQEIEIHIRSREWDELVPMQVYYRWGKTFEEKGSQTWRYMWKGPNMLPHLVLAAAGLALYGLVLAGVL